MKVIVCFLITFLCCIPPTFSQITFTEHTIDGNFDGACCVYAADIDGDDDMDVLGAANRDNAITWWENEGEGEEWTEHIVDDDIDGACSIFAADIDDDGDIDIAGAAKVDDDIAWWENDDDGDEWTQHTVNGNFNGAFCVYVTDINGDGDLDILGTAQWTQEITSECAKESWTPFVMNSGFDNDFFWFVNPDIFW